MKKTIYGFGGHVREVALFIRDLIIFFVDDEYYSFGYALPLSKFNPEEYRQIFTWLNWKVGINIKNKKL